MRTFFDDFDRFFELGFGRPTKFVFNSAGLKDMMPACWEKADDGGYCARVKTLGLTEAKVTVEDYGIKVSGENELEGQIYNTSIELPVSPDVMDNVTEIKHRTVAGITFVELVVDRPQRKKIKITGDK